jgi:rod shape-determining protein MreC
MVRNFYKKYLLVLLTVAAVFATNHYLAGDYLQDVFYRAVIGPSVFLNDRLSFVRRINGGFLKADQITKESARLKEENNILRGELAQLENLKRENQFLRDELEVARRLDAELMVAQIFNIQRGVLSSTALINKGAEDGVRKSMPLIAAGNIMIGVVDQVFDNSALVLLIDDPRVKISGRVQDSRILVDAVGKLQNTIRFWIFQIASFKIFYFQILGNFSSGAGHNLHQADRPSGRFRPFKKF